MNTQAAFSAALLDIDLPCPEGLCSANGADPASRFAVYRNNVQGSLINALADSYPVVMQLVGDEFFRAMAGIFVQSRPPHSPLMSDYGSELEDFLRGFEPASSVPYLADVARLERLRTLAYHAADALPLSQERIAAVFADADALNELRIGVHPSLYLLDSNFAVVDIWAAHQHDATLAGIDLNHAQHALILRNGLEVEVFAVELGASQFIRQLKAGLSLTQALESAEAFDLSQTLALLISRQVITHFHPKVSS
ncbi:MULTISPECIES: DUF2063 domain-containing protein [unclassified Pseudomonas]|uniref:HvfC/BufC N-terminal domain-containing protein n=1 Tax=unclassified Pseudomonas TaxID=196821 RepID=UPI000A1E56B4|nr:MULTISPECIES: DNA-binding domain-containing protein [unclassified Pseudomonas]